MEWRMRERAVALVAHIGRREMLLLAGLLLPAAGLAAFLSIASEVVEGDTQAFDRAILLALRVPGDPTQPIGPLWAETMVRDISALGGTTVVTLLTLVTAGYLLVSRRWRTALLVVASIGTGAILSSLLKLAFARPRPAFVAHIVEVTSPSFPSGHAMLSAITYLTLGALLASIERQPTRRGYCLGVAVLLTLMIGASRVYLGVHYPTDVLAGWSIGAAWAMAWLGIARLLRRARPEDEPPPS
jgi:undecaprenyl-diphosphatase